MREASGHVGVDTIGIDQMLDLALHMAHRADEIALAGFGGDPAFETKADGSPVTRADREIESMLRDTIEREHPSAGILGEEYGEEGGVGRWILDPIDGTREFVSSDPRFSVLIAYELDGESLLGVVSAPALGLRWWAGRGLGASVSHRGGESVARVSQTRDMSHSRGLLLGGAEAAPSVDGARLSRSGVSWEAVRVAGGQFDFALTAGSLWDVAPLPVIVEEAGGVAGLQEVDEGLWRLLVTNRHLAGLHEAI
jgi:histidinol-phosphatase